MAESINEESQARGLEDLQTMRPDLEGYSSPLGPGGGSKGSHALIGYTNGSIVDSNSREGKHDCIGSYSYAIEH